MSELAFRPVTKSNWGEFAKLFESPGAPSFCWCMVWRATGEEKKDESKATRRQAMKRRIEGDEPVGILGYLDGEPVAWCSIAPRETYHHLGGPDAEDGEKIWSLVRFYVPRHLRRQGIAKQLLGAALERAAKRGATVVDAYPVAADSPSYRFTGTTTMFRAAGFKEIGRAGKRRTHPRVETHLRPRRAVDRKFARRATASLRPHEPPERQDRYPDAADDQKGP